MKLDGFQLNKENNRDEEMNCAAEGKEDISMQRSALALESCVLSFHCGLSPP